MLGHDFYFWAVVIGATVLKVATSAYQSIWRVVVMVVAALFCALVFTDPIIDILGLHPDTYKVPMAALLALMGESFIRMVLGWLENNQEFITAIIRAWRGHK
ncbi:MAG: hypothetical protein ACXIVF_15295 [Rhizobiaceae bacterium]